MNISVIIIGIIISIIMIIIITSFISYTYTYIIYTYINYHTYIMVMWCKYTMISYIILMILHTDIVWYYTLLYHISYPIIYCLVVSTNPCEKYDGVSNSWNDFPMFHSWYY